MSFQHDLISIICFLENFLGGYPTKDCFVKNTLYFRVLMIEILKKVHLVASTKRSIYIYIYIYIYLIQFIMPRVEDSYQDSKFRFYIWWPRHSLMTWSRYLLLVSKSENYTHRSTWVLVTYFILTRVVVRKFSRRSLNIELHHEKKKCTLLVSMVTSIRNIYIYIYIYI